MSIEKVKAAIDFIENDESSDFVGLVSETTISKAQEILGLNFPPSYKLFLEKLGCGDIKGLEFYGLIDGNIGAVGVPNAIWLTLEERKTGLAENLIIVSSSGDGSYFALDTSKRKLENECPVVQMGAGGDIEMYKDTFGDFIWGELMSLEN